MTARTLYYAQLAVCLILWAAGLVWFVQHPSIAHALLMQAMR